MHVARARRRLTARQKLLGGPKRTQRSKLEEAIRDENDNFIGAASAQTQLIRVRGGAVAVCGH